LECVLETGKGKRLNLIGRKGQRGQGEVKHH